jgi:hypothetical protein
MKRISRPLGLIIASLIFWACGGQQDQASSGPGGWLTGTQDEKFDEVANQLGGFSRTMVEVGYRYSELYWAGQDENWEYADHQLEHILEALEDGIKRRPARADNTNEFIETHLHEMEGLIIDGDQEAFLQGFKTLTAGCNACHSKEGESFIVIREPEVRTSPVRF